MNPYYDLNYSREQIGTILNEIKECVLNKQYTIAWSRRSKEDDSFIDEYDITSEKLKMILWQVQVEDFCHTLHNTRIGFEEEILYVFVQQVPLFHATGDTEIADIYLRFHRIDLLDGTKTVVISFHKRNKPIAYLFR